MPSSSESSADSNYKLLPDENGVPFGFCLRCEKRIAPPIARYNRFPLLILCNVGLTAVLLLSVGYVLLKPALTNNIASTEFWGLDKFNTTERGEEAFRIRNAADNSTQAKEFWDDLLQGFGLVIIDQEWAEANDLPPTVPIPGQPTQRLYQIGAWHTFHCLSAQLGLNFMNIDYRQYRIRQRLLKPGAGNDRHTMHCFDHLRTQLMCNPRLTLDGSIDYVAFDVHPDGLQCKDLSAIQSWARARNWHGYEDHIHSLGLRVTEAERLLWLDQQKYPEVGWDKVWFRETGLDGDDWLEIQHLDHIALTPGEEAQIKWLKEQPEDRFAWADDLVADSG